MFISDSLKMDSGGDEDDHDLKSEEEDGEFYHWVKKSCAPYDMIIACSFWCSVYSS